MMASTASPPPSQTIHGQQHASPPALAPRSSSLTRHLQAASPSTHAAALSPAATSLDTCSASCTSAATTPLATAAAAEPETLPHSPIPPHLQGLSHWTQQRAQWLAKRPAQPVQLAAPTDLKPELYPVVYHKMVRECRLLAPGKRLRLKDAFSLIVQGWKEDGLLPKNFVSAPASPPLRAQDRSRSITPMSLGGAANAGPSMSRSSSTTPPAVTNGPAAGFLGLSALWKGITSSLPG